MAKRRRNVTKKTGTVMTTPVKAEPIKTEAVVAPAEDKGSEAVKAEPVKTSAAESKVEVKAEVKEAKTEVKEIKAEVKEAKAEAKETKAEVKETKAEVKEAKAEAKTVKTEEKKPAVKKAAAKKEIKVKAFVEYYGKQVEEKDMIAKVKKAWTKTGKKVGDIKTMELYIKPEEDAVYYVINGTETGAVAF